MRSLPYASLVLLTASLAPAQHFPNNEDLRSMLRYLVEDGQAPAIVLGVLEADGTTRVVEYGDTGEGRKALGSKSVFGLGSITKTFTGTILADMVQRGEVQLEDPATDYLPVEVEMPSGEQSEITLLHLATHTSGLPRMPDNFAPADPENKYADYSAEDLYEFLADHELRREPGAEGEYSNLGMGLLSHALERAAGIPFKQLVEERILDPLGMSMTGYAMNEVMLEWSVTGRNPGGQEQRYWDVDVIAGAGGLRSTADDMLKYIAAHLGEASSDLQRAMRLAQTTQTAIRSGLEMGLGWQIKKVGERRLINHGGGTAGFKTHTGFDPELKVGFVILANSGRFDDDLGMDLLEHGPANREAIEVSAAVLDEYAGDYDFGGGMVIQVRREEEGLSVRLPRQVRFHLFAESESEFFFRRNAMRLEFLRGDAGLVEAAVMRQGGTERRGERKR